MRRSRVPKGLPLSLGLLKKVLLPALQRHRRRRRPLAIGHLERGGILRELTGRSRNKIFAYDESLKILSEGTEPL